MAGCGKERTSYQTPELVWERKEGHQHRHHRWPMHFPILNSAVSSGIYHILLTSFSYWANSGKADGQTVLELDKAECTPPKNRTLEKLLLCKRSGREPHRQKFGLKSVRQPRGISGLDGREMGESWASARTDQCTRPTAGTSSSQHHQVERTSRSQHH